MATICNHTYKPSFKLSNGNLTTVIGSYYQDVRDTLSYYKIKVTSIS